ncbi:NAC domain-containing protein 17-like [Cynara cardunculus var. scolymus]|uniref:No apical meristem (NAM) protein n=1 Tax=Cynara cardunculus var. scolymus TaxID=59895 RepID=A0A124SGR5_CYNCS|nr:NAC domain-containing protein 17-like [Cynara cardunculus var. scolymus]KVI07228.1 No apical meristem (NAM) protein [Cynara cardunculus var. scolymus]
MGSESIISKSSSSSREKFFPPGFRFHPTDEELILYYLKRKICGRPLKLDIIGEVDVYKWDPEELPGQSKWNTGDRQWFFFSPRDRKYPNGGRSNRATVRGYWKATGKDRIIKCNSRSVGIKKTLVYYQGRAASGKRTDWVMHEYTLDEEELKRCKYAQEYFALYKVFKKSGPGPKNGEQYGAPFVEEEWADDYDYLEGDALLVQTISNLVNEPKLKSGIMVEPDIVPPLAQINPINGEKESQNTLLACSSSQVDKSIAMGPREKLLDVQPSSDLAQSANKPSEITTVEELQPLVVTDDFLEMDDLITPQPAFRNSEPLLLDNLQFADFDGFCEFDFYNDSTGINEMNPFESQQIQQPCYMSNLDYGMENSGMHSYSNAIGSEAINTEFQMGSDDFMGAQATDFASSAPSGVITDGKSGNPNSGVNQCGEGDGTESWFSSALWAFVESVPSSPASALESSALVNKAFERMPSFSRISKANAATRRVERSSRSIRDIAFISVLGVVLAIFCVLLGTSIKLLGRCVL